jgi:Flp pilus assembly protein TadG
MKNLVFKFAQRVRSDHGNALIELAIGMSVLTALILGAAEFGRIAYAAIEVNDAAHAGAAYGSQSRSLGTLGSTAANTNVTNAAKRDAIDVSGMTATAVYWCQCSDGSASTCGVLDCTGTRIIEYVTVNTSGTVDPLVYVPGLPKSYTVTGHAVMRVEQ